MHGYGVPTSLPSILKTQVHRSTMSAGYVVCVVSILLFDEDVLHFRFCTVAFLPLNSLPPFSFHKLTYEATIKRKKDQPLPWSLPTKGCILSSLSTVLKGSLTRDFRIQVFFMICFPQAPEYMYHGGNLKFLRKIRGYF